MTDVKHTALLPCPFCGGEVHMSEMDDEDDRRVWVREVKCIDCGIEMRGVKGWHNSFDRARWSDDIAQTLTKDWNRRAPDADLLSALKHAVHWHDQLQPHDIARFETVIAKASGETP